MDGTALLALGILLEEALEQSMTGTGHLALLAFEEEEVQAAAAAVWDGHTWVKNTARRVNAENRYFGSVRIAGSADDDSDDEDENEWDSSSPEGVVSKAKPRTESPENLHRRILNESPFGTSLSVSSLNNQILEVPTDNLGQQRRKVDTRSKRSYDNEGCKSTAMVQSSDKEEDEGETSVSENDVDMVVFNASRIAREHRTALTLQPLQGVSSSMGDDGETSTSEREQKIPGGSKVLFQSGKDPPKANPLSEVSRQKGRNQATKSMTSNDGFKKAFDSKSELVPTRAPTHIVDRATMPEHRESGAEGDEGESAESQSEAETEDEETEGEDDEDDEADKIEDNEQAEDDSRKGGKRMLHLKAPADRPEDKMAKFKKSMDDLLERLMSK